MLNTKIAFLLQIFLIKVLFNSLHYFYIIVCEKDNLTYIENLVRKDELQLDAS